MTGNTAAAIAGDQSARREFARRFDDLHRAAGSPSLRTVATAAQQYVATHTQAPGGGRISAQRISDWKAGRNVPARLHTLTPVLHVLFRRARRRKHEHQELLSLRAWAQLWRQAAREPRRGAVSAQCPVCGRAFDDPPAVSATAVLTPVR